MRKRRFLISGAGVGIAVLVLSRQLSVVPPGTHLGSSLGLSLLSIATTLLLIDFVREPQSRLASALEWRPLRVVGQLSYAMYLVHFQAIDLGRHLLFTHLRPATILNFLTDYLVFVALSIAAAAIPTGSWNARFFETEAAVQRGRSVGGRSVETGGRFWGRICSHAGPGRVSWVVRDLMAKGSATTETIEEVDAAGRASVPTLIVSGGTERNPASDTRVVDFQHDLLIGRDRPVDVPHVLTLADDRWVSSRHALISRTGRGFEVVDLGSRNGIFVDGVRTAKRAPLNDGAVLFLGSHVAVFRLLTPDALVAVRADLTSPLGPVGTASPAMALAVRRLRLLAATAEDVLICGETGVGKEVYARAVHEASGASGPFFAVNCAALPGELIESELFGHLRGAHSQASQPKRGLVEQAQGGTLFLDEIGEMSTAAQAKLLRFLQDRTFIPLGGTTTKRVDLRIVAATSAPVTVTQKGPLRSDLAARLGAEPITLPPLRDRPEDIGALAWHFLTAASPKKALSFDIFAFRALCLHRWPKNVRELEKAIREAIAYAGNEQRIRLDHLPSALAKRLAPEPAVTAPPSRRSPRPAPSREELEALLTRHHGRVAAVARELDRQWQVVWRWMGRYGIDAERFRG